MTYGKLSDRCLKVFVVLLIAGVLGGFCLPHFVEAVAGGYNTRAVGMSLGAEGLAAPVLSADFKPQGGELALAKLDRGRLFRYFGQLNTCIQYKSTCFFKLSAIITNITSE